MICLFYITLSDSSWGGSWFLLFFGGALRKRSHREIRLLPAKTNDAGDGGVPVYGGGVHRDSLDADA